MHYIIILHYPGNLKQEYGLLTSKMTALIYLSAQAIPLINNQVLCSECKANLLKISSMIKAKDQHNLKRSYVNYIIFCPKSHNDPIGACGLERVEGVLPNISQTVCN